jgi:ribose-phosphate pyrophosphokinase
VSRVLIAGDAHPGFAREIARQTGIAQAAVSIASFADGETRVRIEDDVRGADVVIVQPLSAPANERLVALALIADAARVAGAAHVSAVIPYFAYARQDVRKHPGEPRSAQLAARILAAAGIERVIALELHSPALESAFPMPVVHLQADELLIPIARERRALIVSPDAGGLKRAQRYAAALGAPLAVVAKTRTNPDVAAPLQVLGDVRGQACLIVDDIASTGRTIAGAARALLAAGAREVHAMFVYAVMSPGALERIGAAGVRSIVTTDSVRALAEPGIEVVSSAPLFVRALADTRPTARG